MRHRTLDEMISYFNQQVSKMDMKHEDKIQLLGMISAIGYEARKTGRWIVFPAPDEQHCGLVECPYCREELIAEPTEYHYCPNCGARMEGESDGVDTSK